MQDETVDVHNGTHTYTHTSTHIHTHIHMHILHTQKNVCYTCHTRSHMYKDTCYIAPTISKCLMIRALTPTNLPPGSTGTMPLLRKAGKLNVECENLKYKETNSSWPASVNQGSTCEKSYYPSLPSFPEAPGVPSFLYYKEELNSVWPLTLRCVPCHVWASFSKLNFITCQIFQPLKNYSIPGLIYNIISKRLASSGLSSSWNDAGGWGQQALQAASALTPHKKPWGWAEVWIHFWAPSVW